MVFPLINGLNCGSMDFVINTNKLRYLLFGKTVMV